MTCGNHNPMKCPKGKEETTYVDLHLVVKTVVHDQTVTHADTMWLHGVSRSIVIVSNVLVVKVSHALLGFGGLLSWDLKCLCARCGLVRCSFFIHINCDIGSNRKKGKRREGGGGQHVDISSAR